MAFAFVQQTTGSETTGTGSYTATAFGSSVTVGNTIYAIITSDGSQAGEITSVTDNKSNTWAKDVEQLNAAAPTERFVSIWRTRVTTGGTGLVITVNYRAADSNNSGIVAQEWSNSVGAPTLDKTKGNSAVATTSPTTGASAATTVAAELVIAGFVSDSTQASFTAGAGYTNGGSIAVTNANVGIESKTVASTGAQTATATFGTSRAYSAILATYFETSTVTPITFITYRPAWRS